MSWANAYLSRQVLEISIPFIYIATNKSPKQWVETIGDKVITTAILDRLLYHCEIIKLTGESFRLKNRKTIFCKTA